MRFLHRFAARLLSLVCCVVFVHISFGQETSVRPGINKPFEDPKVDDFVKRWESDNREIHAKRAEILAACKIKPGMAVADIGAGTGLFTRLSAREAGPEGKVYAVDITEKFVKHIENTCKDADIRNVVGVVCTEDSAKLPENSTDLAFICDTYHHFEFPLKTMASIHKALRKGGRVVIVDFIRIEGTSSDWVLKHVRLGQDGVTKEI